MSETVGITIPRDRSAISVVSHARNPIQDGDDFRPDGWVYGPDGTRRHKWFIGLLGHSNRQIWEPKLGDLRTLEAKRWRWHRRVVLQNNLRWKIIWPAIKEAGQCGGWHSFTKESSGWVNLIASEKGVSWKWTEDNGKTKPAHINQPLVDKWFEYQTRWMLGCERSSLFNAAFLQAIDRRYREEILNRVEMDKVHLIINGRDYWFERVKARGGMTYFQRLAYPEDVYKTEII